MLRHMYVTFRDVLVLLKLCLAPDLMSLCLVDFHITSQLPIQALHSVVPKILVFVSEVSFENCPDFIKTSTPL